MDSIKIWNDAPSPRQARDIASYLEGGGLALMPTDSVYAIVCDALNAKAVGELCRLKGINPEKNHLSVICADISMAAEYAHIDDNGYRLLKDFTPGPFTFLFRSGRNLPNLFKKRKTVGIRIPDCATPRMVAEALGHPMLCTSIEFDDGDHAREPELIADTYAPTSVGLLVDGEEGRSEYTTVIDASDASAPEVVRQGIGRFE